MINFVLKDIYLYFAFKNIYFKAEKQVNKKRLISTFCDLLTDIEKYFRIDSISQQSTIV